MAMARCVKSNCDGHVCQSYQQCLGSEEYGCDCVGNPPPTPTSGDGGGGGGGSAPTNPPRATVIRDATPGINEDGCPKGSPNSKCTNGYYCCQNTDGSAA